MGLYQENELVVVDSEELANDEENISGEEYLLAKAAEQGLSRTRTY